jgi:hypothetical protein
MRGKIIRDSRNQTIDKVNLLFQALPPGTEILTNASPKLFPTLSLITTYFKIYPQH